tara:strand:- start:4214 stop:4690 length:477 start_codon:yes stop_codon:yes gene_type:complete
MRVVSGIEVTLVRTAAEGPSFPVGGKFSVSTPAGSTQAQEWIYVSAGAAALTVGAVVARANGSTTCLAAVVAGADAAGKVIGVAQHLIAIGSFGFIQCKGIAEVTASGAATTANAAIMTAASGEVTTMTATNEHKVIGLATEAQTSALATCFINCPGA